MSSLIDVLKRRNRTVLWVSFAPTRVPTLVLRGVVGGIIATAVMTLYRFPVFRALPPTAEFWATVVRDGEPEDYPVVAFVLHFMYGATAGGLFGYLFSTLQFRSERERRLGATLLALGYGLVLSVFGTRVLFRHVLNERLEPDEAFIFHVGHVIYGLTLGTWLTSRERVGDVYE